jgi:chromosome segregation ATPase
MRLFRGLRRPAGGFMMKPDDADRQRKNEQDARRAEAERLVYIRLVQQTNRRLEKLMATLDQVLERVAAQRGQIDSLAHLTASIKEKLMEAISSAGALSPAQQAQVDKVFNELDANTSAIVKAINKNDDDPSNDEPAPQPEPTPAPVVEPPAPADPMPQPSPVDENKFAG